MPTGDRTRTDHRCARAEEKSTIRNRLPPPGARTTVRTTLRIAPFFSNFAQLVYDVRLDSRAEQFGAEWGAFHCVFFDFAMRWFVSPLRSPYRTFSGGLDKTGRPQRIGKGWPAMSRLPSALASSAPPKSATKKLDARMCSLVRRQICPTGILCSCAVQGTNTRHPTCKLQGWAPTAYWAGGREGES